MPAPAPQQPDPSKAGKWQSVFIFSSSPATGHLVLRGMTSEKFRWRVYGAGVPFYQEGTSSGDVLFQWVDLWVGWTGGFCSVDILTKSGVGVQAWYNAFPGRPPGMPPNGPPPN